MTAPLPDTTILAGSIRTFGTEGPAYEVLHEVDTLTVRILVLTTGEELNYPAADARQDPLAD